MNPTPEQVAKGHIVENDFAIVVDRDSVGEDSSDVDRQVIMGGHEGLSESEIAEMTGLSNAEVRRILNRLWRPL